MTILSRNLYPQTQINLHYYSRKSHYHVSNFSALVNPKRFLSSSIFHARKSHIPDLTCFLRPSNKWALHVDSFEQEGVVRRGRPSVGDFNFDAFLSVLEFLCLASSFAVSILYAVNSGLMGSQKVVFGWLGNRVLAWQCVVLVGGLALGAIIRRRQWTRICNVDLAKPTVNLVDKIEKLEEDLKYSNNVIRVLSRQLEKLGIRFRVTRKSLKEPIAETVALAQKNSEATRILALQEDILEKELVEIQKVLLAMQEQQQKQLELIVAIGTSGKLREGKDKKVPETSRKQTADHDPVLEPNRVEAVQLQREANIDQAA